MVSFFRPGVWEIDVETIRAGIRQEVGYKGGGICPDYANVSQVPSADAVNRIAIVFAGPFDAEEIGIGIGFSLVEDESSSADSDFDMKRC